MQPEATTTQSSLAQTDSTAQTSNGKFLFLVYASNDSILSLLCMFNTSAAGDDVVGCNISGQEADGVQRELDETSQLLRDLNEQQRERLVSKPQAVPLPPSHTETKLGKKGSLDLSHRAGCVGHHHVIAGLLVSYCYY